MTGGQLRRVAIALVIAVVLWGLVEILSRRSGGIEETALLPAIPADEIGSIDIEHGADTVQLRRAEDDAWTVNGFVASPAAVTSLLGALGTPTNGELVARNPSSHARMGLDAAAARRFTVRGGDRVLGALLIGHQGRAYQSAYMRRPDGDDVYLVEGELVPLLDRGISDWRDRRIVAVPADSIQAIEVERGRRRYALERRDGSWVLAGGGAVDSARVARLAAAFADVEAQGTAFATPAQADSADFTRPERRVVLTGSGGATLAALAFDSTANGFWVRRDGTPTVFHLLQWKADELTPADSTLRRKE
jgi:hypothetical protein